MKTLHGITLFLLLLAVTPAEADPLWKLHYIYDGKNPTAEVYELKEKDLYCSIKASQEGLYIFASGKNHRELITNQHVFIFTGEEKGNCDFFIPPGSYDVFGVRCAVKAKYLPKKIREMFLGQWGIK